MTIAETAELAGLSRGPEHRIETGSLGCSIGAAFELAAIVGVNLFETQPLGLPQHLAAARDKQTLFPKRIRQRTMPAMNDF